MISGDTIKEVMKNWKRDVIDALTLRNTHCPFGIYVFDPRKYQWRANVLPGSILGVLGVRQQDRRETVDSTCTPLSLYSTGSITLVPGTSTVFRSALPAYWSTGVYQQN